MTSQGTPYGRFRRALDRRQPTAALSAAAELPHVSLTDALELLLLLRDTDPPQFERAALRWHARFCFETRHVRLTEATAVLALLCDLAHGTPALAARTLAETLYGRGLERPARILLEWSDGSANPRSTLRPESRP